MNILSIVLFILACALLTWALRKLSSRGNRQRLANSADKHLTGNITKKATAAIAIRYTFVKFGADVDHIAVAGTADIAIGSCTDEPSAAEETCNVAIHGATQGTLSVTASGVIAIGDFIVTDTGGKARSFTGLGAGTYYLQGRALTAAAADLDVIEYAPIPAVQRVV